MYFGRTEGPGNCQREDGQNGKKITSKLMEICPFAPLNAHINGKGARALSPHSVECE